MYEDEIPIGHAKDLRGQKFGRLTVIKRTPNKGKQVAWECQCDCGNSVIVRAYSLLSGNTKSCGCVRRNCAINLGKSNKKDLTGEKFGRLTVIKDSGQRNNQQQIMWECKCDCGNTILVSTVHLTSGHTKSCGCSRRLDLTGQHFGILVALEPTNQRYNSSVVWKCQCDCGNITYVRSNSLLSGSTISCGCLSKLDLTGKRFGKLIALEPTNDRRSGYIVWKCQCDCGNVAYVESRQLIKGKTNSCGCLTSKGEMIITNILQRNNIIYKSQKTFESCRFDDTGALARFDFYINEEYLIEFDGIQHFEYKNSGWDTEGHFEKVQKHDDYKNQWCKDNNIPLIRIPYTKLDTLCIEDLMLETTQFRVV